MPSFNWRRWLRSLSTHTKATFRRVARPRLVLESLEDRLAPADFSWTGLGANGNWSNTANWSGGVAPKGLLSSLDNLIFPSLSGSAKLATVNDLTVPAGTRATFNSITISGSGYNFTNKGITLGDASVTGSGYLIVNGGASNNAMAFDVQLGAGAGSKQFFTVDSGADLTIT